MQERKGEREGRGSTETLNIELKGAIGALTASRQAPGVMRDAARHLQGVNDRK